MTDSKQKIEINPSLVAVAWSLQGKVIALTEADSTVLIRGESGTGKELVRIETFLSVFRLFVICIDLAVRV